MSVEFVNRELAESEAARAIGLLNQSDEAKVEAWFALQTVADQVGPVSNVGIRGIRWSKPPRRGGRGEYALSARCVDGYVGTSMSAPSTLEEARHPDALSKAQQMLALKSDEMGGRSERAARMRHHGTGRALSEAVSATDEGRAWLAAHQSANEQLLLMVRIADSYGRDGVNPKASRGAHSVFLHFEGRAELIRAFPTQSSAQAKAMSLRHGSNAAQETAGPTSTRIPASRITRLAIKSGVTRAEARTILRACADGRSKTKLIRAVNEAFRMVDEIEARESSKVAA